MEVLEKFWEVLGTPYLIPSIELRGGVVVETYEYSAFGVMMVCDDSGTPLVGGTAFDNPYGYTGRRWDGEADLWYYRARSYSPSLGRFLQRDPAGYVDGMNLYAYVANNPLRYLDPMGLKIRGPQILGASRPVNISQLNAQMEFSTFGSAGFGGANQNVAKWDYLSFFHRGRNRTL